MQRVITRHLLKAMEDAIGYPATATVSIDNNLSFDLTADVSGNKLLSRMVIPLYDDIPYEEVAKNVVSDLQHRIMMDAFAKEGV